MDPEGGLDSAADTTGKVTAFGNLIAEKVEEIFPTKEIKVYDGDKEFMTPQLRKLRRQKSREYGRKKRSEKFLKLQKEFLEIKVANSKEYIKEIEDLKNCNLGQFFHKIKQIGSRQGECSKNTFSLSSHVEGNLDAEAAAEQIALHFSSISKEYPPIDPEKLPDRVKEKIFNVNVASEAPVIEDYQVYEMFKKRKMKNSSVPGDVPTKLKKEFLPEFSGPAATIFNSITKSGFYPRQWVTEFVTPIPKVTPPDTEDDLRNISLTADLSKDYENFLAEWLMPFIKMRIDPGQFGGLSGHSTTHYLITLYHFILSHTSTSIPTAVMVALIDFSKAFNRINHAKIIVRLSDWDVPGWLLRILVSYLTGRSMILRYKGVNSTRHLMSGGSPQGALLGVLLYFVYVSDIGMDLPLIPPPIPGTVDLPSVSFPPDAAVTDQEARLKFVDDLSVAECVRLDTQLQPDSDQSGPRQYHDRNGLIFPPDQSALQKRLDDITKSASIHDMKLNLAKSKIIPFNFTRKYDFVPTYSLDGAPLEVVYETKLLGLTLTSDCKWEANTKNIVQKGNSRLWFLRRLKILGASQETLIDIYKLFCRSVLEFGAPVWSGALTVKNKQDIERVQKTAMIIIAGSSFTPYDQFLDEIEEDNLDIRRDKLCLNFAKKCLKTDKFSCWFPEGVSTRSGSHYFDIQGNKKRLSNSAIPHLTRLLNSNTVR